MRTMVSGEMKEWFTDLNGNDVEAGSRPVFKLFVIDPDRKLEGDWILRVLTPDPWEQVIITNVEDIAALAAFSGAFESRGQARKAGMSGSAFHGIELYGTRNRSFFVWNPESPGVAPTMSRKRLLTRGWWDFLTTMGWLNR